MKFFKALYDYRELLKTSISKDVRGKYKNSVLGISWSFLNPLLQIAVYALVFPLIMRNSIPNYTVFICCGLIPWTFCTSAINRTSFTMVENGNIIKTPQEEQFATWEPSFTSTRLKRNELLQIGNGINL